MQTDEQSFISDTLVTLNKGQGHKELYTCMHLYITLPCRSQQVWKEKCLLYRSREKVNVTVFNPTGRLIWSPIRRTDWILNARAISQDRLTFLELRPIKRYQNFVFVLLVFLICWVLFTFLPNGGGVTMATIVRKITRWHANFCVCVNFKGGMLIVF